MSATLAYLPGGIVHVWVWPPEPCAGCGRPAAHGRVEMTETGTRFVCVTCEG